METSAPLKATASLRKPKTAPKLKQPYTSPVNGQIIQLTDNQHEFTEAALTAPTSDILINRVMEIYQTNRKSARVIARQNFLKPSIEQYLGDRGYKALDVLNQAMTDTKASWSDRITAANSVADRQFGRATQRVETHSTSVNLSLSLKDVVNQKQ